MIIHSRSLPYAASGLARKSFVMFSTFVLCCSSPRVQYIFHRKNVEYLKMILAWEKFRVIDQFTFTSKGYRSVESRLTL